MRALPADRLRRGETTSGEVPDASAATLGGETGRSTPNVTRLRRYGVGVDLYFKGLKGISCCFFAVALLSAPAVASFYTGARDPARERDAIIAYDPPATLYYASLGAWGEHTVVCGKAVAGDELELACPAGAEIVAAFAYYGNPSGACSCPEAHQVEPTGACPGEASSKRRCRDDEPCFAGVTNYGDTCCAIRANSRGEPDFDRGDVHPAPAAGCDSSSAKFIAQGACLGARNCTLAADFDVEYEWTPRSKVTGCGGFYGAAPGTCRASFGAAGDFDACPAELSLLVTAFCGRPRLALMRGRYRVDREAASSTLSWLDALGAGILLWFGLWLRGKEKTAGRLYKRYVCTPADYTVAIDRSSLPDDYDSLDELAMLLRSHFEHVLSKAAPVAKAGPVIVADVNFGINNRRMIRLMQARGALARRIDILDARVTLMKDAQDKVCCGKRKLRRLEMKDAVLRSRFDVVQTQLADALAGHSDKGVRAVTAYRPRRPETRPRGDAADRRLMHRGRDADRPSTRDGAAAAT